MKAAADWGNQFINGWANTVAWYTPYVAYYSNTIDWLESYRQYLLSLMATTKDPRLLQQYQKTLQQNSMNISDMKALLIAL